MAYHQLTTEERYMIATLRQQGRPVPEIAAELGRHPSTVRRELQRNATPHDGAYRPSMAVEMTNGRRRRSRRNARYGAAEFAPIEALLRQNWSPEQIVGRRRLEKLPVMSHETIYLYIWRDRSTGGTLWQHLRGAQKRRRKRYGRNDSRGRLAGKTMIDQRPAVVDRRTRIGDWELDTVHGRGKPCVATAVERKCGVIRIGKLAQATAALTTHRTVFLLKHEPHPVFSLTSDNGTEFHGFKDIARQLDTQFYFATPHHAWERGSNENANGLLRQYLPKGTDLSALTQKQCNQIAALLNHRPRRRLGFRTPLEVYHASLRLTRR